MNLDEFIYCVEDSAPLKNAAQIGVFERKYSVVIPDDYKAFLLRCNGGYTTNLEVSIKTKDGSAEFGYHHIAGLRNEDLFSIESSPTCPPNSKYIWIADDAFGNELHMSLETSNHGKIYPYDHDEGGQRFDSIFAESFSELVENTFAVSEEQRSRELQEAKESIKHEMGMVAIELLKKNVPIEDIAKGTPFTEDEIKSIIKEMSSRSE